MVGCYVMAAFSMFRGKGLSMSYECHDEGSGILGSISPKSLPLAQADDLAELETKAYAHLCVEPNDLLYLVDSERRVRKIIVNEKYHEVTAQRERTIAQLAAVLLFAIVTMIASALGKQPAIHLIAFACVTSVYLLAVRMRFLNEVEAGLACTILLVVVLGVLAVKVHAVHLADP